MGVAIAKPHPYIVNSVHTVTWKPHAKIQPEWSFNSLLAINITSDGCDHDKTIPIATPIATPIFG